MKYEKPVLGLLKFNSRMFCSANGSGASMGIDSCEGGSANSTCTANGETAAVAGAGQNGCWKNGSIAYGLTLDLACNQFGTNPNIVANCCSGNNPT